MATVEELKTRLGPVYEERRWRDYGGWRVGPNGFIGFRRRDGVVDVLVQLPGQSCEALRLAGVSDQEYVKRCRDLGGRTTRIDFAVDTTHPKASPQACCRAWHEGRICTRVERALRDPIEDVDKRGQGKGKTWDLGNRKWSDRFMRVYEKAAQMARLGAQCVDENGEELPHLTRFELQSRSDVADVSAAAFADHGWRYVAECFRGFFTVVSPKGFQRGRTRLDRAPLIDWYKAVFGDGAKWRPGLHRVATPEKALGWVERQVSGVLKAAIDHGFAYEVARAIKTAAPLVPSKAEEWRAFAQARGRDPKVQEALAAVRRAGYLFEVKPSAVAAIAGGGG